jgi:ubiquinone/menaquinone biosynthesis C-methylase UbiE
VNVPIHIVDGKAEFIPHSEDTFDVVHAANVIEHVLDVEEAFKEIYRVLKPGECTGSTRQVQCVRGKGRFEDFPCSGGTLIN